ncbi:hypothetical protein DITRI_Ditri02bG0057700 [Diplodiscus trichospermus]
MVRFISYFRSAHLGEELLHQLLKVQKRFPNYIKEVRGRGLFTAVEFNSKNFFPVSAYDICVLMKERGVLTKTTRHNCSVNCTTLHEVMERSPACGGDFNVLDELQEASMALRDVLELDLAHIQKAKPKGSPTMTTICDRCGRNLYNSSD